MKIIGTISQRLSEANAIHNLLSRSLLLRVTHQRFLGSYIAKSSSLQISRPTRSSRGAIHPPSFQPPHEFKTIAGVIHARLQIPHCLVGDFPHYYPSSVPVEMIQTIAIEEACLHPGYTELSTRYTNGRSPIVDALCDIHGKRLDTMNKTGNEYQVLSLTSPGPQGETDVAKAEELARVCNDWIAGEVKKNPKRFGAFCSLSMHRPAQAAQELRRAVKELGLVGAILNDWQATGEDGNGILLYDTPDFDPFWEAVQDLKVPVYFHPKWPNQYQMDTIYATRRWLTGATCQFHVQLTIHIQAMIQGGVFDRFPGAQIIVGHLGENLPMHIWRADQHAKNWGKMNKAPMQKTYDYYFHNNIFVTTSGNFNTKALLFTIDILGADRVIFSIDAPYEKIEEGQAWWKSLESVLDEETQRKIGRENAIKLLNLPLK